jgi:hypothetical protein
MSDADNERRALALEGVELCRRGRWGEGLQRLGKVTELEGSVRDLPSEYYAYLGYGIARFEDRVREGLRLCERAVKQEFYRVDNYAMLARTALLANNRHKAVVAVERGLAVDRQDQGLLKLKRDMGVRRPPVLPFLSRESALNRLLGRLRHAVLR